MTTGSVTSQPGADNDSETYHVYIYLSNSCRSATNEHTRRGAQIKLNNLQNMLRFAAQVTYTMPTKDVSWIHEAITNIPEGRA